MLRVENSGLARAAELIRDAKRPIILAGHGISESGAMETNPHSRRARANPSPRSRCSAWATFRIATR